MRRIKSMKIKRIIKTLYTKFTRFFKRPVKDIAMTPIVLFIMLIVLIYPKSKN